MLSGPRQPAPPQQRGQRGSRAQGERRRGPTTAAAGNRAASGPRVHLHRLAARALVAGRVDGGDGHVDVLVLPALVDECAQRQERPEEPDRPASVPRTFGGGGQVDGIGHGALRGAVIPAQSEQIDIDAGGGSAGAGGAARGIVGGGGQAAPDGGGGLGRRGVVGLLHRERLVVALLVGSRRIERAGRTHERHALGKHRRRARDEGNRLLARLIDHYQ